LEKYHRKFFLKKNVVITISAYQLKPQVIQKICSFIKERKMPARLLSYCSIKCSYSGFKIKEIKQNIGKNFSKVVVTFPAYSSKVKPAQRISLDILGRLLSDSPDGLSSQLRGIGIYSLDNTIITWRNMGLIYFSTSIMNQKLLVFLKLINGAIKELKNKEISRNKLNLFLRQIKQSEKRAFNDNLERINWINYDLIHYDRLMPIEEDLKIIDQITTRGLKAIARKVFKKDLVNIIIIGENVEKIEKDKIKKALDF
jgi:predicted Zn-dependent peptidase